MKISIVTVVFNEVEFIKDCINSVVRQDYPDIEYIVIDGGSTDGTTGLILENAEGISRFCSEKDEGLYDALNKGIELATGEVVGILHADDVFAHEQVLSRIAARFKESGAEAVYGHMNYISRKGHPRVYRKWISEPFLPERMTSGWMPPHPALFIKRTLFQQLGPYRLKFGTCADYELMLRYFYRYSIHAVLLDQLLVNMRLGGASNGSLKKRMQALNWDYKALKMHRVPFPFFVLILKRVRKIRQFF